MNYIIHNEAGEILRTVSCAPSMIDIQLSTGEDYIEGTCDDELDFVENGLVADRYTMSATLSGNIITGLPVPCTVSVDGQVFEVPDGILEFSISLPGTYDIICGAVNYLPKEFSVTI